VSTFRFGVGKGREGKDYSLCSHLLTLHREKSSEEVGDRELSHVGTGGEKEGGSPHFEQSTRF